MEVGELVWDVVLVGLKLRLEVLLPDTVVLEDPDLLTLQLGVLLLVKDMDLEEDVVMDDEPLPDGESVADRQHHRRSSSTRIC